MKMFIHRSKLAWTNTRSHRTISFLPQILMLCETQDPNLLNHEKICPLNSRRRNDTLSPLPHPSRT